MKTKEEIYAQYLPEDIAPTKETVLKAMEAYAHQFLLQSAQHAENIKENKKVEAYMYLRQMLECNQVLYEKILDTPGFAYYFNELVKMASR